MSASAAVWEASPTADTDAMTEHLRRHGVFDAADEMYERIERGEGVGPTYTPAEMRAWLNDRLAK